MPETIPFPPYRPDLSSLVAPASGMIQNVVPQGDGYGPFKSFEAFSQTLPDHCHGFFFARLTDGSIAVFAGTDGKLYKLDNTTSDWVDVSKAAGTYPSLVTESNWRFAQYNNLVMAVQINTVPQKFTLGSSTEFADLGGSPPQAGNIAIIGFFVVLAELLTNTRRVQWSDLDSPEVWTAGTGLSDFQDLPDGGNTVGVSGGDNWGLVFQEDIIRRFSYAPGSTNVFDIVKISEQDTLFAKYSPVSAGSRTFYISAQGFKMVQAGGVPVAIGKDFVDEFFFGDVDRNELRLINGATDPSATAVYFPYKSVAGATGSFDKILRFDWSEQESPWSLLIISGEYLANLSRPGLTLEQLDAIAPGKLTVLGAAASPGGAFGAGVVRLTLDAVSNADFQIAGQNFIVVQNVGGTTEANGTWMAAQISIVDATHIDINEPFVNAWTSGGAIGGSLDALPFSLDSISRAAIAALAMIDSNHKCGFFTGPNLEATLETAEIDGKGDMLFLSGTRPITDAAGAMVSIGRRARAQQAAPTYTTERAINAIGFAGAMVECRYPRARLRIPAGETWTYARGVQPEFGEAAGEM